jgi:N-acyl homoserine lactone hydrolase
MPHRNRVDVLIQPFCLRFSLQGDEIVYHVAGHADAQLDAMERAMGVDVKTQTLFDANLGFLPVSTTVLIRGEKTILVDPGNYHIGFYGPLGRALSQHGLTENDVDIVVATHAHHDHLASLFVFDGKELVIGEGETDFARMVYGAAETDARFARMSSVREVPMDGAIDLMPGVRVIGTPGHTPGHVSVLVEDGDERIVIAGDAVMTRNEYETGVFSHWYTEEQARLLEAGRQQFFAWQPTMIYPGHDRGFRP